MMRRHLMRWAGLMVLAGLVGAQAAEQPKPTPKASCACCGASCTCSACTCDAQAANKLKDAKGCACGGTTCCTSKSATTQAKPAQSCCATKPTATVTATPIAPAVTVAQKSCVCCGDACTCVKCICESKAVITAAPAAATAVKGCCGCGTCGETGGKTLVHVLADVR